MRLPELIGQNFRLAASRGDLVEERKQLLEFYSQFLKRYRLQNTAATWTRFLRKTFSRFDHSEQRAARQ